MEENSVPGSTIDYTVHRANTTVDTPVTKNLWRVLCFMARIQRLLRHITKEVKKYMAAMALFTTKEID